MSLGALVVALVALLAPVVSPNCSGDIVVAQRGCCSWHKGVCGCEDGRKVCCDGTLSPSCGC